MGTINKNNRLLKQIIIGLFISEFIAFIAFVITKQYIEIQEIERLNSFAINMIDVVLVLTKTYVYILAFLALIDIMNLEIENAIRKLALEGGTLILAILPILLIVIK